MNISNGKQKTWVVINGGKPIKGNKIDIRILAKILTDIQKAYDNIGHSKYGNDYKKEDFHLYIGEIVKGSVALPLAPSTFAPRLIDDIDPFGKVTQCFENLIDSLNTSTNANADENGFKNLLEEEIIDPSNRIGVLKSIHSLSECGSNITLKNSIEKPTSFGYSITKENGKLIKELLETYTTSGKMTIHGLLSGFQSGKKPYYFIVNTENGRNVRCYFEEKDAVYYHSYFWKWVTVTGDAKTTQASYKLNSVFKIQEDTMKSLDKIGDYPLQRPILFTTSYDADEGVWGLVNEDLALYGYGTSYIKAIKSLEGEIEGHVISFTRHPDEEHSKESIEIKARLQTYVDFAEVLRIMNERYGFDKDRGGDGGEVRDWYNDEFDDGHGDD